MDELAVLRSLNGLLDWFIVGASSDGPLFTTPFADMATPGVTILRTCIALYGQNLEAGEQRAKDSGIPAPRSTLRC